MDVKEIEEWLRENTSATEIVLFGSLLKKGDPGDVDVFLIYDKLNERHLKEVNELRKRFSGRFMKPLDAKVLDFELLAKNALEGAPLLKDLDRFEVAKGGRKFLNWLRIAKRGGVLARTG